MRCGYIILTGVLWLAVASPAVYAVALLFIEMPTSTPRKIFAAFGLLELFLTMYAGVLEMDKWLPALLTKAKAELDALRAGLRGEDAP